MYSSVGEKMKKLCASMFVTALTLFAAVSNSNAQSGSIGKSAAEILVEYTPKDMSLVAVYDEKKILTKDIIKNSPDDMKTVFKLESGGKYVVVIITDSETLKPSMFVGSWEKGAGKSDVKLEQIQNREGVMLFVVGTDKQELRLEVLRTTQFQFALLAGENSLLKDTANYRILIAKVRTQKESQDDLVKNQKALSYKPQLDSMMAEYNDLSQQISESYQQEINWFNQKEYKKILMSKKWYFNKTQFRDRILTPVWDDLKTDLKGSLHYYIKEKLTFVAGGLTAINDEEIIVPSGKSERIIEGEPNAMWITDKKPKSILTHCRLTMPSSIETSPIFRFDLRLSSNCDGVLDVELSKIRDITDEGSLNFIKKSAYYLQNKYKEYELKIVPNQFDKSQMSVSLFCIHRYTKGDEVFEFNYEPSDLQIKRSNLADAILALDKKIKEGK
jgi:hypothetical protein